ncbi:xylulokinase [Oribacterium sp. WCC10]|uniref:xylulokinase n=1 Tax=Oribacterium sp. WCC10 TaxID=1855343 RepID=UPI0008E199A9|nr:xylulokinase [Oribacterium sp. WCC10]SFG20466.1 xylulokinase [Oribacterium sp. WCC10]
MYYIGIDLGTSAVKLLLMREDGRIQNVVSREYELSFPHPGWSEQNPEDWYRQTLSGLKDLISVVDAKEISGIGFGGQMHGLVALDENDNVIRPAILWNDGRTEEEVKYLNEQIGKKVVSGYTGNIAFAGFTAPKILWMKKNEPDLFARIKKIMLPKDYLAYRLSGSFCTDYSDASGMLLLDVKNKCWSSEMLKICGITENMLPKLYESYEAVGYLKPEIADSFSMKHNVVIAAGAGDNAAAAVGTGTVGKNKCNISLGTSGTIFITSDSFRVDTNNALHAFAHADGRFHLMGCMLSAASCNKWWMDNILLTDRYKEEQEGIKTLGENHVYFLPYLMGERSPWNDPKARGAFIGMNLNTSRAEMTQAVLEGVAFATRDMYEAARSAGVSLERSMICGGGAKSPLWQKMIANILNISIDIPSCEEGPGMGGAMLAMVADHRYNSVEEAAEAIVSVKSTCEPEPLLVEKYEERYQSFRKLYPTLKDVYGEL